MAVASRGGIIGVSRATLAAAVATAGCDPARLERLWKELHLLHHASGFFAAASAPAASAPPPGLADLPENLHRSIVHFG